MEPLHHRRPGPVAASLDALARGATYVELIADGVHLADETVHLVFAVDPGRHVVLVSDAMAAAGMPDGDFELGSVRVRVADGRAWTRTDPPSLAGGTSHAADLVRHCVVQVGVDPGRRPWPRPAPHPPPCWAWTTAAAWRPACAPTSWCSTATGGSAG